MNDLISRRAAIKAADSIIERDTSGNNDVVKAMTAWKKFIEGLPPAQPGWIPCSERPPEKSEWYLLTAEWDDGLTTVMKDRYVVGEGWTCAVFGAKCLAWQPLPTPYRKGSQDG